MGSLPGMGTRRPLLRRIRSGSALLAGAVVVLAGCGGQPGGGTQSASSSSTTTRSPASSNESPAAPSRSGRLQRCPDVKLDVIDAGASGAPRVADKIIATGVSCTQAAALVRAMGTLPDLNPSPRPFPNSGFECRVRTVEDGPPSGHYVCTRDGALVTWVVS